MDARRLNSGYYFRLLLPLLFLQKASGCQDACSAVGLDDSSIIPDSSFTANSVLNTAYAASKARFSSDNCWEPNGNDDANHYLQIDLGKEFVICAVATKGNAKSTTSEWTTEYKISTSSDGNLWISYSDNNNSPKLFPGNTNWNSAVKNDLVIPVLAKWIRFTPTQYNNYKALRVEVYGVDVKVCSKMSVGVPYSSLVPDHRFSASSYIHSRYLPSYARLKNTKAWEPKTAGVGDWLQIDLGSVVYVCAVATQGNAYSANEYVKKYKLEISLDNVNWKYYQENNADKVFTGNTDKTTIVTNTLAVPTKTKFLRFYPTVFNGYAAMRVDVYGVPATCRSPFGVEKGGSVKDSNMTSLSKSDSSHAASSGRLYGDASWCSNTLSKTEYIQIDLAKFDTLIGIATQGDHTMNKWVKNYTLKYSLDGSVWNDYRGNQTSAKEFCEEFLLYNCSSIPLKLEKQFLRVRRHCLHKSQVNKADLNKDGPSQIYSLVLLRAQNVNLACFE